MAAHHLRLPIATLLALSLAPAAAYADTFFTQTNLVSDVPGLAAHTDPNLINPWGMSFSGTSPFWVSDQATGLATLYDGAGNVNSLVVAIPGGGVPTGPTGQVFNGGTSFLLNGNPARFIFSNLNGTISAWNGGSAATQVAMTPGAIYTGLAIAGNNLYAANNSQGRVDVFNSSFMPATLTGNFTDPNLPAGFTPYNVQTIGNTIYVTFAHILPGGIPQPGGYVDAFNTDGTFIQRIASGGPLFAPWGITLAPSGFGSFGGDLLVGNFGAGTIDVFSTSGTFLGALLGPDGLPIVNGGLWALDFRTGGPNVNTGALYITAGINNEHDGLFAEILPTPEPSSLILLTSGLLAAAGNQLRRRRLRT